jgi:transposase
MDVAHTHVCGIDVHQKSVSVCLLIGDLDTNKPKKIQKSFRTTVAGLKLLATFLDDHEIELTVMESTGQYWRPVWTVLAQESETTLRLVNPQRIKNMPGRKTDIKDAEWLAELSRVGMIKPSYIPEIHTIELRETTRLKKRITQQQTVVKNQIQNILERSNIKLKSFVSDAFGVTCMKLIQLLIDGEVITIDGIKQIIGRRLKATPEEIFEAMEGTLSKNDRILICTQMELYRVFQHTIAELDVQIESQIIGEQELRERLIEIPGIAEDTAAIILAEIGSNVDAFENEMALASWAGLCPGSYESGGKSYSAKTNHGNPHIKAALSQAAMAAKKKRGSHFNLFYFRIVGRTGKAKANIALAHKLLRVIYNMIKTGERFDENKLKSRRFVENLPA